MIRALSFLPAVVAAFPLSLFAGQEVVERPEQLRFEPLEFEVPRGETFRHRLTNGILVYVAEDTSVPLVDVAVALPVGGFLDPPDQVGMASLTAAMMRRGGTERLAPAAFDDEVDYLGAEMESSGGGTRSGLSLNCTSATLGPALELLVEALRRPRFDASRLEQAKSNLMESMRGRNDDPLGLLDREWRGLISGPEHHEARALTASTLERIERQDLVSFHQRHWRPDGLIVAVSGDVATAAILQRLEDLLGSWSVDGSETRPVPGARRRPAPPGLYHLEFDTPQVKVVLGHQGLQRRSWDDPEAWTATVLREILAGDGPVSRLRRRLRAEERIVYRVSSHLGVGLHDRGEVQIFFESEAGDLPAALEVVLEEMMRLREEPVPDFEIELARRVLVDAFPLLFDSAEKIAGRFAEDALLGRPHSFWRHYRDRVESVGATGLRRLARRVLRPDDLRILIVGPAATIDTALLESIAGSSIISLPWRDPLTLEPQTAD